MNPVGLSYSASIVGDCEDRSRTLIGDRDKNPARLSGIKHCVLEEVLKDHLCFLTVKLHNLCFIDHPLNG